MTKCPRCKLPQEGMYKCQYCGYKLPQGRRGHIKLTREKLRDLIDRVKKEQIVSKKIRRPSQFNNHTERRIKMR